MNDKIDSKIFQKVFLLASLLLAGCATKAPPQVQYVRVEVPVPVQVPCRAPEVVVPAWAAPVCARPIAWK